MNDAEPKLDRRARRTRALLREALLELILEKGFDAITVKDITDRADVSRVTFYLHFKTKEELLFSSMRDIYDDLVQHVRLLGDPNEVLCQVMMGNHEACLDATDFKHVAEYARFYKVLLSDKGAASFVVQVRRYLAEMFRQHSIDPMTQEHGAPRVPPDLLAHALAGAQIGAISWWLESDMQYTPEEMARMFYSIVGFGLWWSLGLSVPAPERVEAASSAS